MRSLCVAILVASIHLPSAYAARKNSPVQSKIDKIQTAAAKAASAWRATKTALRAVKKRTGEPRADMRKNQPVPLDTYPSVVNVSPRASILPERSTR